MRRQDLLLAAVSGAFVLTGVALRDQVPWYATAFFAVCLVVGVAQMLGWLPPDPRPQERLEIDDAGVTRRARGLCEHVAWKDIERVRIVTTDRGPQVEDVFFVLDSKAGDGCVVGQDLAVRGGLLEALQSRLPGLNNGAVIEAMGQAQNRVFTIWEAEGPT